MYLSLYKYIVLFISYVSMYHYIYIFSLVQ